MIQNKRVQPGAELVGWGPWKMDGTAGFSPSSLIKLYIML
jgi:hypothetical protein